jgi:hypothetical protein
VCFCTPDLPIQFCGAADCHPVGISAAMAIDLIPQVCPHLQVDSKTRLQNFPDGRSMLEIRLYCVACRTPMLFKGLPRDRDHNVDMERASTDATGMIARLPLSQG